ncbi:MAG: hypothetical protein ACOYL6_09995 [Bacteriovoracaceae bacterium]
MRNTLIILTIFFSLLSESTFALDKEGVAYIRKRPGAALNRTVVVLTDLTSTTKVEGKYFKVVKGTDREAISFKDLELANKATHAYYHANLARKFFVENFPSAYVKQMPQVVIRLEMTNFFDDSSHFIRVDGQEDFNNSLSIPAATDRKFPNEEKWGNEIWFRPAKEIKMDNGVYLTSDALTNPQIRTQFYESIGTNTASQMARELSQVFWDFSKIDYTGHIETLAISIGVVEILPRLIKLFSKNIKRKVYLDAVMFPEVIYHEYAHVAFSDHLPLNNFSAVVEGYANYFASYMTGYHKLMYKGGKFVKGLTGKNSKTFQDYSYSLEAPAMAQSSFSFKLLNDLREKLGVETFHPMLLQAATKPDIQDSIRFGLINSMFDSVDDLKLANKTEVKFHLHAVMHEMGL